MIITSKPNYRKKITYIIVLIVATIASMITITHLFRASAAVAGWNAGRIISDSVFTNKNTMTVTEIQSFLNSKVPICNTNGEEWGRIRYNQSKFTCLKDYRKAQVRPIPTLARPAAKSRQPPWIRPICCSTVKMSAFASMAG